MHLNALGTHTDFYRPFKRSLLERMWEKEKMLVTRIFSFSHIIFCPVKDRNHQFGNTESVICKCLDQSKILLFSKRLICEKKNLLKLKAL